MSSEDSAETRQNNEFAALEAIYGEDLHDLRGKSVWNKWQPLNFKISLTPQQGGSGCLQVYAKLDLHVFCGETYPDSVPKLKLENAKGLSDNLLFQLQSDLDRNASELRGEEMIFQLCQHVQEFLHKHNKPAPKSFYDEMLQKKKEKEEEELQKKMMEEDRQRQFMQQEVQKRQEMLKNEARLRREHRYNSENSNENDSDNRRQSLSNNSTDNSDECLCEHKNTVLIEFGTREIKRGQCIKHYSFFHVVFIGMDVDTGELVLVNEWMNTSTKQLASLEQEFNYLTKLKHQNLVHYLSFKYVPDSDGKSVVYILEQFINGPSCLLFMNEHFNVSVQFIKYIAKGVLRALDYLHRNNVVHKDIRDSCIYITEKGYIALANYSLHRRLADITDQTNSATNYSKKSDVHKFGEFLLALLRGAPPTNDEDLDIPTTIPSELHDFLTKCLEKQEKERWTASQLLNHQFLRHSDVLSSPAHKIHPNDDDRNVSPEMTAKELALLQRSGQSRLDQEFVVGENLGKGAFGDVVKARNILDDRFYAIKRIKLNPKNKQLNKKIVREVKLLSGLNHENIVRYYNSWIEKTVIKQDDSSDMESTASPENDKRRKVARPDEFTINDNIEDLAPPMKNFEVSITYDSKSQAAFDPDDSSSEDDESWGVFERDSDSDGIEFEKDSTAQSVLEQSNLTSQSTHSKSSTVENGRQIEFMYIQMEFCEKSTLRTVIDTGDVYKDGNKVRKLFREIVEGLAYIHQQGMIHRDLKPVNIFLDSEGRVKIGDFGLATNMKTKLNEFNHAWAFPAEKAQPMDESKTGLIGTALYVAPELSVASKANYDQKVDIYSLGIIYFEMCYRPLATAMERIAILTGLRDKAILIPEDFPNDNNQKTLIRWLLNQDYTKRPTSQEVLQSEHVPAPQQEESTLRDLVRKTLGRPQSKTYKYLIASCFNQTVTPAQDITYDKEPSVPTFIKPLRVYGYVREVIVKIFKQHGAQNLSTPLLMPKSRYYNGLESCVKLMTHFGGIVSLPHDLRVPFARYVASNGITMLRRYSIERVYREKKVFGFLPRELYECAFDIVTPNLGNHIPDAEILYVIFEIIEALPGVKNKQVKIRLNHPALMEAILLHYGIKDEHKEALQKISDYKDGKMSKLDLQTYFIGFGLSDNLIAGLTTVFSSEFEASKAASHLQNITKKKSNVASSKAKQALQELKTIAHIAEAFGVTYEMVIAPGVTYNVQQYSGMICQFVCELKKKHKHGNKEVLAAGGRYDSMIASYREMMESANMLGKGIKQSAVGISLSLDKLVQAVMREPSDDLPNLEALDVAVCSLGVKTLLKEKTNVVRSLWSVGIRCVMLDVMNSDDIREQCAQLRVPHVVVLKDTEPGTARVHSWERDRFQEKTFKTAELVENMQRIVKSWKEGSQDVAPAGGALCKSDSKSSYSEKGDAHEATVSIVFVTVEKMSSTGRRRSELVIKSNLDGLFKKLSGPVTVLGVVAEKDVVRTIAAYLEWDNDEKFHTSLNIILERHIRSKKYLGDICEEIYQHKCKKTKPAVILFNLQDFFYRLLI